MAARASKTYNKMPLIDKISLNPIEKYIKYDRFPWKMLTHIILVMAVTAQIVITINSDSVFARAELAMFYKLFLSSSLKPNEKDFEK
jgi:hypothetical protein